MRTCVYFFLLLSACFAVATSLNAQALSYVVQHDSASAGVLPGTTIALTSDGRGKPASISITATYQGQTAVTIFSINITGPPSITLDKLSKTAPVILNPGESVTANLTYKPTDTALATAQLSFTFQEKPAVATSPAN